MRRIILISVIFLLSIFVKGQEKDTIRYKWNSGITIPQNISIHSFPNSLGAGSYYPFSNAMRLGFGINLYFKKRASERTIFITGIFYNAVSYQFGSWKDLYQTNGVTYNSFGIPFIWEKSSSSKKKITFNYRLGFQLGFISNAQAINVNATQLVGSLGGQFIDNYGFRGEGGGFMFYGIIGFGWQYKINNKLSLFFEPELFQDIRPLTYHFYDSLSESDYYVYHFIQFLNVLSLDYKF
jgi:hypothetical protein